MTPPLNLNEDFSYKWNFVNVIFALLLRVAQSSVFLLFFWTKSFLNSTKHPPTKQSFPRIHPAKSLGEMHGQTAISAMAQIRFSLQPIPFNLFHRSNTFKPTCFNRSYRTCSNRLLFIPINRIIVFKPICFYPFYKNQRAWPLKSLLHKSLLHHQRVQIDLS